MEKIEKYSFIELNVDYNSESAFIENIAEFKCGNNSVTTGAFRKGDKYAVRFSPQIEGIWQYKITLPSAENNSERVTEGSFECIKAGENNHGSVFAKEDKFYYSDGEKYYPFGTTCYAWINQPKELREQTIETLKDAPFNKIRMCIFPKSMPYNNNEPDYFPFEKDTDGAWNVNKPVEAFWSILDKALADLRDMNIEADIILFHPYDRWGFSELSQEDSVLYLRYCIQRLSAYRNVWWSLANEYDAVYSKTKADWDEYGEILSKTDIYHHLISIHNMVKVYPDREWLTHCSIQSDNFDNILRWKKEYGGKPVILDEFCYEGNIEYPWGSITGLEEVHRFWQTMTRGGYATHGETFHRDDEVLWWAKGGKLYGQSPERIAFLKELIYSLPDDWNAVSSVPQTKNPNGEEQAAKQEENGAKLFADATPDERFRFMMCLLPHLIEGEKFKLYYLGRNCPCTVTYELTETYRVEVIDIWEMTRKTVMTNATGTVKITLPAKEGIAVLLTAK